MHFTEKKKKPSVTLFCNLLFLPLYFQHLSLHHFIIFNAQILLSLRPEGKGEGGGGGFLLVKRGMSKILHDVKGGNMKYFCPLRQC